MKRTTFVLCLALLLALPWARAQDMGGMQQEDPAETEKRLAELAKGAKRFLASVKISAKEAAARARDKQAGLLVALHAEQQAHKDKAGKEEKLDVFEATIVRDVLESPPPPSESDKDVKPPKEANVFTVQVDAEGRTTLKETNPDEMREAANAAKRLAATKATVSLQAAIEAVAAQKAQPISVVLEDRDERKDKKTEAWLVYALVGDRVAWFEVDATTGEVEKRR